MKIVINTCHGGFSLSKEAIERYAELKGITLYHQHKHGIYTWYFVKPEVYHEYWKKAETPEERGFANDLYFNERRIPRDDPALVQVVKELKHKADGFCAALKIVNIPDDVKWVIEEYDGLEWVAEQHRTWS